MTVRIRLIDLDIDLPEDVRLVSMRERLCVKHLRLDGSSIRQVMDSIKSAGVARSYQLKVVTTGFYLVRDEQRIGVFQSEMLPLEVTVDDPEKLPLARVTEDGVEVGPVSLAIPRAHIFPRRERHDPNLAIWIGEWRVKGLTAGELSTVIVNELGAAGLTAWGPFVPKDASIGDTWSSEAFSRNRFVKVHAVQEKDEVLLRLEVFDTRNSPAGDHG